MKAYTTSGAIVIECPECGFNVLVRKPGPVQCPKCAGNS